MRGLIRELLSAFVILTVLYLALINFTGFTKDIGALGSATTSIWKTAQGR